MSIKRERILNKFGGRCAYCGKLITLKDMQVDHIVPKRDFCGIKTEADRESNLNPSCRRCNHYKRSYSLEMFRDMLKTLHERIQKIYICKVAQDYKIVAVKPFDGKFYFENFCEGWAGISKVIFEDYDGNIEEEFEFEDGTSDEEIEKEWREWAWDRAIGNYGWRKKEGQG